MRERDLQAARIAELLRLNVCRIRSVDPSSLSESLVGHDQLLQLWSVCCSEVFRLHLREEQHSRGVLAVCVFPATPKVRASLRFTGSREHVQLLN